MDLRQRAQLGKAALHAGGLGRGRDDRRTDAIEVVANVLHYLESIGADDPAAMLSSAATHYFAEKERVPWRSLAAEHLGEAADTLCRAALIGDPYMRADAIWEAPAHVQSAAARLCGREARACLDIVGCLERGCDGSAEPPEGATLVGYARTLDGLL